MYNTYPNPRHTTNCKRTKANSKLKWDFTRFVANLCQCVAISDKNLKRQSTAMFAKKLAAKKIGQLQKNVLDTHGSEGEGGSEKSDFRRLEEKGVTLMMIFLLIRGGGSKIA